MIVPFGNGLILGYLMYKSGLVPRRMAWLGLIGGPLLLFGNVGVLFDWWDQTGAVSILVIPEFIWEAVPRHLLRDLGLQAGLAHRPSELARVMQPPDDLPTYMAATAGPVWRRVRGAVRSRLVPQRWQHAGLRGSGSGLDDVG